MPLATGQRSQKVARLGVMRLGATRLGWYQPWIKLYVNGVLATNARVSGATITDELNHEPNTASFNVSGIVPVAGQSVTIQCGDTDVSHQLFGGRIIAVNKTYEAEKPANVIYRCNAIDPTWLLNRRKVTKKYTSQSATAIALDVISSFTSGVTTVNVAAGLATLDEITFTNEEVTDALTRIVERIGGYWYIDYSGDLHLFLSETVTAFPITTAAPRGMAGITNNEDLSQAATRVIARGGGANVVSDVLVSGTTVPVGDISWYAGGGGTVECGPQRITYTGVSTIETGSTTGFVSPPPLQTGLTGETLGGGGGTLTGGATYLVAMTYKTAEGQTTISPVASVTLGGAHNAIISSFFTVPTDPKITLKSVYVSSANGDSTTLRYYTDSAVATTQIEIVSYSSGAAHIPTSNTAGFGSESAAAGSTSVQVEDLAQFPSAGWAAAPGDQIFSYTGRSASTGAGTLTGIPASGAGSLTAAVRAGTVKAVPHLTGCSGIAYALVNGDPVNIVVIVNDAAAQTALATRVGGDGIHEMFISDGRWSITEATARANAELSLRKDPLVTVSFTSRDPSMQSGRDVTLTITSPAISGTFKIQRVTITELGLQGPTGFLFPLRQVEASSRRYSFEDLLRRIRAVNS
jgi:hypothetical protein